MERGSLLKVRIVLIFIVSLFILSGIRLLWIITGRPSEKLKISARKQFIKVLKLLPERGKLEDRNCRELVENELVLKVERYRRLTKIQEKIISKLGLSEKNANSRYAYLGEVPFYLIDSLIELKKRYKLPIRFEKAMQRIVLIEQGASPLIGRVGRDGYGLYGLEFYFEKYLRGRSGKIFYLRTGDGRDSIFIVDKGFIKPLKGKDFILSIDWLIQEIAYLSLKSQIKKYRAKGGFVIITEPFTGKILALVSYPIGFNENFAINYPYEPGSTFKLVVYSKALEEGLIKLDGTIDTKEGVLIVDRRRIRDVHKLGKITWREAFAQSSNVAAATLSLRLGSRRMYEQLLKLGFYSPTGSFFRDQCKSPGDYRKWKLSKLANLGIGYGLLVNGLQMAMAYGAVANGGYLYSPGFLKDSPVIFVRKVFSEDVINKLKLLMRAVIEEGTGKKAKIEGLDICGKTGTAMIFDKKLRRYNPYRKVVSFIGFFPCDRPAFLIYVVIFEPQGKPWVIYGGEVAAPVFKRIAMFLSRPYLRERKRDEVLTAYKGD